MQGFNEGKRVHSIFRELKGCIGFAELIGILAYELKSGIHLVMLAFALRQAKTNPERYGFMVFIGNLKFYDMIFTEDEKKEIVLESSKAAAKILIFTMNLLELENYIEGTIVNETDGRVFKLKFERIKILNEEKNARPKEGE